MLGLGRRGMSCLNHTHGEVMREHIHRVVKIRLYFDNTIFVSQPDQIAVIPTCHAVARAYAEAFNVDVQDGWKHTYLPRKYLFFWKPMYRYGHTWNIVTVGEKNQVLLDIFPEETCSLLPIMMRKCDSVFYYQKLSKNEQRLMSEHMDTREMTKRVTQLKEEFLRIDAL